MPNYTLDLPTILAVFRDQKRTGELRSENIRIKNRGVFQVKILFRNGQDVSCRIENMTGQLFVEGEDAKQILAKVGLIEWTWVPQVEKRVQQNSPSVAPINEFNFIFQQSQKGRDEVVFLPRLYQRIFMLVNGQRTVIQIASFFPGFDAKEAYRVLIEMYKRGWLTLG